MAASLVIEEESGTCTAWIHPHNGQAFATWYARIGHDMFDRLEPAWLWWSAEKPELEEE